MLNNLGINRTANNYPRLFTVLLVKISYTPHFSQRKATQREMVCKEKFNYSNLIFNERGKKEDQNSFM